MFHRLTQASSASKMLRWGLLILAGMSNTLGFAPYNYSVVPILSLVYLLYVLDGLTPKQAALGGWFYGLGWFGAGISWVHVSIDTFGGLPLIVSLGMMAGLVAYLSLYPALACGLSAKFSPKPHYWLIAFPLFWFISEFLRSIMLSGFPWLSLGYSQFDAPLASLAPVIGEIGITFVLCLMAVALKQLLKSQKPKTTIIVLVTLVVTTTMTSQQQWTKPLNQTKTVVLVQGNIEQEMRWVPENDWPTMLKYLDLSRPYYSDADLLIWPEAAIPLLEPLALEELHNLDQALADNNTGLITGIIDYHSDTKVIYNSLISLGLRNPDDSRGQYYYGHNNRYNKHHLLPIGEFVPFEDFLRPLAPIFDLPMSSFTRGEARQINLRANGINLVPAICYEIIFPRLLRQNIDNQSDFILTVSNDAWFGDSIGPLQHMQIAQMRALEFGRPLLRATNNGVTAITDHQGQIMAKLPQFEVASLKTQIPLVTGTTPYLSYGDMPLWIVSVLGLLGLAIGYWRANKLVTCK